MAKKPNKRKTTDRLKTVNEASRAAQKKSGDRTKRDTKAIRKVFKGSN